MYTLLQCKNGQTNALRDLRLGASTYPTKRQDCAPASTRLLLLGLRVHKDRAREVAAAVNDRPLVSALDAANDGADRLQVDEDGSRCLRVRGNLYRRVLVTRRTGFDES
jgi:hypothetical protein